MPQRPSFILYITDQHRADFLGCYGHPRLQTPNIDALAQSGICFDRFYVASPVCMPNRASLMTARMPSSHNVRCNGVPLDQRHITFVELLREAGYKTALIGKSHLQTFTGSAPIQRPPEPRPGFHKAGGALAEAERHQLHSSDYKVEEPDFWSREQPRVPTPFYGFDHVELVTGHGDHCGGDYQKWLLEREPNAAELIGADKQLPHAYTCPQAIRTAIPEQLYSTSYIAERAAHWLDQHADDQQPFFLMVSWPDPHHPFNPPGRYWDMYDPAAMPVPAAFERDDWQAPPHVQALFQQRADGAANLVGMNAVGCSAREAQEAQALTCGMISMIDAELARVQQALRASGKQSDTVSIFTTDHGDHLGDHRLLFKGAEQYEQITRVPFIWADPAAASGTRSQRIGQSHDIGTTILERARVEAASGMQGRCLFSQPERAQAYIQYMHQQPIYQLGRRPHVHSLRNSRYRLSLFQDLAWGELYDLETDPGEFDNLWDSPAHQSTKAILIEQLAREQMAHVNSSPMPTSRA